MAMHFINVVTLSEISKTVRSIGRKYFSINWKIEEIHHEVSGWLDRFSIPVWSIKKNIQSIERNSWLIEKLKKFIMKSPLELIGSRFLFDQSKEILDQSRLMKLNFSGFSRNLFWRFTWTKHSPLIITKWDWDQNWISLIL